MRKEFFKTVPIKVFRLLPTSGMCQLVLGINLRYFKTGFQVLIITTTDVLTL